MKLSVCFSVPTTALLSGAILALTACSGAPSDSASSEDDVESAAQHGTSSGSSTSGGTSGGSSGTSGGTSGGVFPPGSCVAQNGKADRHCTPGAFNPAVTQATIGSTICVVGWTDTIRPPASYTTGLKNQQKPEYGEANTSNADLEEDHLVPLELGGNPHDPSNLWPEPRESISPGTGAETKDNEESALKHAVCSGQMTLDAARQKMLADWTH
jgi:hypothetical protein